MITQNFNLNVIPESSPVIVHCDQYDTGDGRLVISLFDDSVAYTPEAGATAIIQGTKPDGHGFIYSATISGNKVTADLTQQMSACAGHVRCQVVITETDGRTGTFIFILAVQKSALTDDADLSETDISMIEDAIEEAQQAVSDAQDAALVAENFSEDAEAWAVGERGGVPVDPSDETYHNNAEYWAGQAAIYAQGALRFQGSIPFASIPTTGQVGGDMYNITDDFTTDARFIEGAGVFCPAGTNIAWVAASSKWDVLSIMKIGSLDDLTDVSITSPLSGDDYLGYDPVAQEFKNKKLTEMSNLTKGIGRPDGKTTDVSLGVFSAIGVNIPAEVNSGGTQYGANWLYYAGTTEVITPDTDQNYRVTDNGTTKLYFWNGSSYEELTSGGGGGGMNTDGSNAATDVGFSGTKVFTVGDRTGKAATGAQAFELGDGATASGYGAYSEGAKCFNASTSSVNVPANTLSETLIKTTSLSSYPYQCYSLTGPVHVLSNIEVYIDGGLDQDETITNGNVTVRLTQDGTNIKAYGINTDASAQPIYYGYTETQNVASGDFSHVEGAGNTASVRFAHAEGKRTQATGESAHAEGTMTTASGGHSHAEGMDTYATGAYSHAEGSGTRASSYGAHAEGLGTKAFSTYQHVSGKYNVADNSDTYALIVGNGTGDGSRSNALTLEWTGKLQVAGDVKSRNGYSLENIGQGLASINATGSTNTTGSTIKAGTYFYYLGILVRAKTDIANGATFTLNTNYEVVSEGALNELSVIYSTAERRVGTWIDGTPIYERTFYVSSISTNKTATVIDSGTSATKIIDYNLGFTRGAGQYGGMKCFYGGTSDYFASICSIQGSPLSIFIYIDTSWALNTMSDYDVTVQYLK